MPNVTFHADVVLSEGVRSIAKIGEHELIIDEPVSLGGTNQGPNPVEYVLASLGGCINVLVSSFAKLHRVEVKSLRVHVEGDLDPDGFLKANATVRPGFQQIRYRIEIDSPSDPVKVRELIDHVERVCPIKDTLSGVPVVSIDEVTA